MISETPNQSRTTVAAHPMGSTALQQCQTEVAATKPHAGAWMTAALLTAAGLGSLELTRHGAGQRGTVDALRVTARWAYCFFWPAYAGGALAATFGPRFRALARRGRELGLAFAAAQSFHIVLVAWLYAISPKPPLPLLSAIYFGIGILLMYVLALFSIPSLAGRLSPPHWRALRILCMEYIALAFLRDFLQKPLDLAPEHLLEYAPFAMLGLAGLLLRSMGYARLVFPGWARSATTERDAAG